MLTIKRSQLHGLVLMRRDLLIKDLHEYLAQYRPNILFVYPAPYLRFIINDSIELAAPFNIDDVYSMRLFVSLRWDIAPGFYKQAQINQVLSQIDRPAEDRFSELATAPFAMAWEEAQAFDNPREWRSRFWGISV